MPHELTLNVDNLIAISTGIAAIGGAAVILIKFIKPLLKPLERLDERIGVLEQKNQECSVYFTNDKERLDKHDKMLEEQAGDNKIMMESIALLMQHAETGNNTGEVRAGRVKLEKYLINR